MATSLGITFRPVAFRLSHSCDANPFQFSRSSSRADPSVSCTDSAISFFSGSLTTDKEAPDTIGEKRAISKHKTLRQTDLRAGRVFKSDDRIVWSSILADN